jgi:hypothetical protein
MNNYKSRNNLPTKTCLGRCGDNWVTERVHIGDTGRHGSPCSCSQHGRRDHRPNEMGSNRAGMNRSVLQSDVKCHFHRQTDINYYYY